MEEIEKSRRESRAKQLELFWKIFESWFDRTLRLANLALVGNSAAIVAFLTTIKEEDKLHLVRGVSPIVLVFGLGAITALLAMVFARSQYDACGLKVRHLIGSDFREDEVRSFFEDYGPVETARQRDRPVNWLIRISVLMLGGGVAFYSGYATGFIRHFPK